MDAAFSWNACPLHSGNAYGQSKLSHLCRAGSGILCNYLQTCVDGACVCQSGECTPAAVAAVALLLMALPTPWRHVQVRRFPLRSHHESFCTMLIGK